VVRLVVLLGMFAAVRLAVGSGIGTSGFLDSGGQFTTIQDPLSGATPSPYTVLTGINDAGEIVGSSRARAFVYIDGIFTTLSDPLANPATVWVPQGINDAGQIVGYSYLPSDTGGPIEGFLDTNGTFTTIAYPQGPTSIAAGINNFGQIVGYYIDQSGAIRGYSYSGGIFTTLDDPLATSAVPGPHTYAFGINDAGQIVGRYYDASGKQHGFLETNGTFTNFDDPFDPMAAPTGINNAGEIVGYEYGSSGGGGFLYSDGTFIPINDPLALPNATQATGINNMGQIVGNFEPSVIMPEPSTFALVFLALLGMTRYPKRKQPA